MRPKYLGRAPLVDARPSANVREIEHWCAQRKHHQLVVLLEFCDALNSARLHGMAKPYNRRLR